MQPDSIDVFPTPVDSFRVAAQDVTSQQITNLLDFTDSIVAFWNLINVEYVLFVCLTYYIVCKRVPFIKTNSVGRRNFLIFSLTIIYGAVGYLWRDAPLLNLFVTGASVNAFYEFILKGIFKILERWGILKLPDWYINEVQDEKLNDIDAVQKLKSNNL